MTLSRVKEIIEKRFQITMTKNMNYQILWRNHDVFERILVSNIRSDYMIVEIENSSTALLSSFADEKQLIKILNSFVNIAGELNKNNKEKKKKKKKKVV